MPVRLARAAVVPGVEERKQTLLLATVCCALLPCAQASVRRLQIILLQDVCLLLVRLSREDEVLGDDGEFVEHEQMRWVCGGDVDDVEFGRRVFEGVEGFLGGRRGLVELWEGLLCERGAVA